ncbi:MAG: DNA polymerase/3'-5' exonuclease PolX, partial [Chloroflexota bacterium]
VEQLVKEGTLEEVPGVGEAIAKKITELVTTGRLEYYEKLKAEFPEGITALLDIPGVGPKTAKLLSTELGIKTVDDLEAAITSGKVASLYRMGDKTAENILRHIQALRKKEQRIPIGQALIVVDDIVSSLKDVPGLKNLTPAGSLRRFRETIGDIDLMGTADDAGKVIKAFTALPQVKRVLASGTTKASVIVSHELQVDLRIVEHDSFGSTFQYFTGSKQHNINLRTRALKQKLSLSEYGITNLKTNELEKFTTEEAFYKRLGMQYIPPEIREGTDEIDRAAKGTVPKLIELGDIKGDLHVHSKWSDGRNTIEEMAKAAKAAGFEYIAIADHSLGRGIARGLNIERLKEQIAEIKELNRKLSGIHIFTGMEVDIRADGTLDIPDEVLKELEVVTASIHSGLEETEEKMTKRVMKAMENPNVDILAHPTARLMPDREPVEIDMEAIFQKAVKTRTMLEINAMPERLDLKDTHIYRARELGIKLVINTDAHSIDHFGLMRFGVGMARRGWCERDDIINTMSLSKLTAYLKTREI